MEYLQEERFIDTDTKGQDKKGKGVADGDSEDHQFSRWTVFGAIWRTLLLLSEDPFPDVSVRARAVIDGVFNSLINLPRDVLEELPLTITPSVPEKPLPLQPPPTSSRVNVPTTISRSNTAYTPPSRTSTARPTSSGGGSSGGGLYNTLKRTASVAYNLAMGGEMHPRKSQHQHQTFLPKKPKSDQHH